MKRSLPVGLCLLVIFFISCSSGQEEYSAVVQGNLSVADSVDNSGDYSGIGVTILRRDSANADADTLYHQATDSTGFFSGIAQFTEKNRYPMIISRGGNDLGQAGIILADGDSVFIDGELPDLGRTLSISSREHEALEVFQRVDQNFQRVLRFAQSGVFSGDSLDLDMQMWSDLYWEVYEKNPGTLAARYSASESVRLLGGWDEEAMMNRIRQLQSDEQFLGLAATYGKNYLAETEGLDYTLSYLDTLHQNSDEEGIKMRIHMERIELLYDSARVDQAKQQLAAFEETFSDHPDVKDWLESITYDLNYLSPGDTIPDFAFGENGQTISRDSLKGTPYILEISPLSNPLYQQQYDRTVVIHSIYKNFGLQVITIPLDDSQITVDAFFEERVKPWPVAPAGDIDRDELLEKFNVQVYPTRFLVDREGKIVRKYIGREYTDVIQGIQLITQNTPQPS